MMDLLLATSGGEAQAASGGYVDDVFSAYTYTGNGSTQTINNGIDLAGKGGLVWIKSRSFVQVPYVLDSSRGLKTLATSTTDGHNSGVNFDATGFALNSNGVTLPSVFSEASQTYVSWTFRKAQKFFDVVTYTGNGVAGRQIAHSLGVQAGFVTVKATSATGDWNSYHRSATGDLKLNLTDAQTASRAIITAADANTFTVSGAANTNGVSYVAYLWAHDPSADGIIQCGSFTTDGSGNATVSLGWEPQFSMVKASSTTSDWIMLDSMRGWNMSANDATLLANASGAETVATERGNPTATGFDFKGGTASQTYIYLAIRRPNKPPTSGTQVYNASLIASGVAGTTPFDVGFPTDMSVFSITDIENVANNHKVVDRLRGGGVSLNSSSASAEVVQISRFDLQNSAVIEIASLRRVIHSFRRAAGFMDVVCDTGAGVAHAIAHNLTKAPELIIRKSRSAATQWEVWHFALAATEKLVLNSNAAKATDATAWNSTLPAATQFTVGTGANVNANAATFVTYLFATLAGISKVGSYTGNGATQTINCGFSTGSRFILVKRTDATGDWYVWDSVRGIIAANDPHLSLNTTAVEVTTDDSVDPDASGFIVNQNTATNVNVNGGQYIFLAIS